MELENLGGDVKGKGTSGGPMRPKLPMHRPGAHCFVVARKRGNSRGAKGAGLPRRNGVNGETGGTPCSGGRRQPSLGGHEPDESRGSCPDLWEARGAIPRAYPATGNRVTSNRTEGTTRKRSHMPTGRLKPLRLFSTLLAISLIYGEDISFWLWLSCAIALFRQMSPVQITIPFMRNRRRVGTKVGIGFGTISVASSRQNSRKSRFSPVL